MYPTSLLVIPSGIFSVKKVQLPGQILYNACHLTLVNTLFLTTAGGTSIDPVLPFQRMSLLVKMAADLIFLVLMLNVLSLSLSQDPCSNPMKIPNIDKRNGSYEVLAGDSLISDRFLKEGWYGTGDGRTFLDAAPGFQRCGTLYPIWRKEKIGDMSTMCVQSTEDDCSGTFTITTMLCGTEEIYNLKKSSVRNSAYCFGWPDGDQPPVFAETPIVDIKVVHTSDHTSELEFHCKFNKHSEDVFYRTNWLLNGDTAISTDPRKWENGDVIQKQALTEEMLRKSAGITTVGFEVRCSLRASYATDKQSSPPVWSDTSFIGIKVSKTSIVLKEGQSTDISLQLTAPFGCGQLRNDDDCLLDIVAYNIDQTNKALVSSDCGKTIKLSQWNIPALIKVFGKISADYGSSSQVIKLKLKTGKPFTSRLWSGYSIGFITVQITKDTSKIEGKSCYATNDPHMKTFDGRRYEHQFKGNFTMYKHNTLPVEVQLQTASCNNGRNAWCNCGVAVRAGKTVFEFNRCPGYTNYWTAEYTLCDDGGDVLQVKRKGKNYEVYLPTGGKVKVSLYGNFLNVEIYPSVQDVENSAGLCGKLSDVCSDDFVMRDGSYSTDTTADGDCNVGYRNWENLLTQFSNSWSVEASDLFNLFNHENHQLLSAWLKTNTFCSCPAEDVARIVGSVDCTATEARDIPTALSGFTDVAPSKCSIRQRRKRRSAPDNRNVDRRLRRQAAGSWTNGWTEETAQRHCEQLFQDSKSVQVCGNVTGVETTGSIDNCVMDIWLTGTTIFGSFSIDTVRSKCLHEISVNPVLRETMSVTNHSVYDVVVAQACSNDCSGKGTCMKGECICETHYGGDDCSVDLRLSPELAEVENDGHCDTSRDTCHMISIYGETFLENGVSCLVEEMKVGTDGVENTGSHIVAASTQSISHVQCSISTNMDATGSDDTEFVRAYRISVANTGTVYSNSVGIMVYDGTCVIGYINGTDFKWSVKGPFCVYKGTCIAHMDTQPGNTCQVCDVTGNIRAWKRSSDASCVEETKDFPVIPVVAGVAGVIVLALILVIVIVCVKKRK